MLKYMILFLISSTFCQYTVQDTFNITLYYEALCPDCEDFLKQQLCPGYKKLGDSLVIDLVPYGNAHRTKENGKSEYICQHGPKECFGNKMQGCVFKHYPDTHTQMNFLECLAINGGSASAVVGEQCANINKIEWSIIEQCYQGPEGDAVMAHNAERTETLTDKQYVPWIIANGNHNVDVENALQTDLVKTVCDNLKVKPKVCYGNLYTDFH